ncbi:MAG: DUF2911 domain-containing protein [Bacteroidia bacterium]|nr:DUF2911 domain-containing protein [Bacteroidia bacterium]
MIKKLIAITFFWMSVSSLAIAQGGLKTPAPSPFQKITQAFGLGEIQIEYSRPSVKGRVIFGDLVPYGKIWRTGANASTKFTFSDDVIIAGKEVKAGTYAVYTIPGQSEWEVMLYNDLTLGGNTSDYNTANEVVRFKLKSAPMSEKVETFTIAVNNLSSSSCTVDLNWDKTRISIPVQVNIDGRIMKQIDEVMGETKKPYYQAANYYYENNKDMDKAAEWCAKAVESSPKLFWVSHLMAKIEMKRKNYESAVKYAEMSKSLATEQKSDDYVKMNDKLITEARAAMSGKK